jgi:thiamine-phosphate pyrophosphorylase
VSRLPDRLLIVTDRHQCAGPLLAQVEALLAAGARWIWLRDKDLPGAERLALARRLREATAHHRATLTIGADLALAEAVEADGVQLPAGADIAAAHRRLGPTALIGVSCHGGAEARQALAAGADYATLSPIFASASKPGYGPALGTGALAAATPSVALGGVTPETAGACLAAGASAVAVMGEAMRAADPAAFLAAMRRALA